MTLSFQEHLFIVCLDKFIVCVDIWQCSGNNGLSEYMAEVRGQWYSHVWVCGWALDLQVHCDVAFLPCAQPVGPQAEVHLWRPFNLEMHTPL